MSESFKRIARANAAMARSRSRSHSRSRSVTPGPQARAGSRARRCLIAANEGPVRPLQEERFSITTSRSRSRSSHRCETPRPLTGASARARRCLMTAVEGPNRPPREDTPEVWKLPHALALQVSQTPRGSLRATGGTIKVTKTPRGSVRRLPLKETLAQSIHVEPAERVEEMGLALVEGEATVESNLDHVRKWLDNIEVTTQECPETIPFSCRTPVPAEDDIGAVSESFRLDEPEAPQVVPMPASGGADVQPSTSGMAKTCGPSARIDNVGSEFDSDFDDEFNMNEFAANAGRARDIPNDEELEEHERTIIHNVTRAMDEAVDRLTNVSVDFNWQSDFDTFRGVPEEFSGSTPGPIEDYDIPYDAFTSIWSRDIMEHIVLETNKYAKQVIEQSKTTGTLKITSRLQRWVDTDVDEMYIFFAVYIFMGLDHRTSQDEYWKTTGYLQMPMFRKLMSYNRYILLSKFIHFADNSDASQNLLQNDGAMLSAKLAKIAPVLKHLNRKFSELYNLQQDVAIDESLTLYKGRLSWVQAIRSKAARFGIKSFELCESKTGYLWKFIIYTGKNSDRDNDIAPSTDLAGKSTQVVLDLLKGLEHRGHLVTMDNFYNCPALARYLKSLGFDCLGTLRPNRKHVPVDIAKAPKNAPKGTIIARHSGDVSCIAWKDSKMVNMISTYHTAETFVGRKAGRDLVKPIAVRDYNNTMGGVDLKDQKLSMYLLERKRCLKWYMKIFKRLLNVSVLNAFILLMASLKRRDMSTMTSIRALLIALIESRSVVEVADWKKHIERTRDKLLMELEEAATWQGDFTSRKMLKREPY